MLFDLNNISIITNKTWENLDKDLDIKEFSQTYHYLKNESKLLLPYDDKYYKQVNEDIKKYKDIGVLTFGSSGKCNARVLFKKYSNSKWDIVARIENKIIAYSIPLKKESVVFNSLGVLLNAYHLGLDIYTIFIPFINRMDSKNDTLKNLRTIEPSDIEDFKTAINKYDKKGWIYYFPLIYFWSLSSTREILIQKKEDIINLYLLDKFKGDTIPRMQLYIPTLSSDIDEQQKAFESIYQYKGYKTANIVRVDKEDLEKLKILDTNIKFEYKRSEFIYDPVIYNNLEGKKFRNLRQQLTQMSKHENISTVPYEKKYKQQCIDLYSKWEDIQNDKYDDVTDKNYTEKTLEFYDLFSSKDLNGLVVLQNKKVISFAFVGMITNNTLCFYIGKSDNTFKGVQSYIRYTLMKNNQEFKVVNDGGGLTKGLDASKRMFRPILKHKIYRARINSFNIKYKELDDSLDYNCCAYLGPFRIFYNTKSDKQTPKKLRYKQHKKIPDYIIDISKAFYKAYEIYIDKLNLKDPTKKGIYFDKGARFIDILIKDIPIQKGLVAAELIDNSKYFTEDKLKGKAIKIQLHNDLIINTATPTHELFHVFQYNYCNFNNMWFMEGLGRWAQNLTHKRKMIDEKLPQNIDQLEFLLSRAHDAEYFFRQLLSKSKNQLQFIKVFLEECEIEDKKIQVQQNIKWTKELKKTPDNNKYILSAILNTIDVCEFNQDEELNNFIDIIKKYESHNLNKNISQTFIVKEKSDLDTLETIDEIDGDLIIEDTNIISLNSFNRLKKVKTIKIKNNDNLKEILGFNGLESIKNLEISNNKNLEKIYGFFKFFSDIQSIDGYIKIEVNKKLEDVSFLKGIRYVGSSFYLHNNNLQSLKGLEYLEDVDASLSLSGNSLLSLEELKNLKRVDGMLGVAYNNLVSLDGIENLKEISVTKWGKEYRSIALQGNTNLQSLKALENTVSNTNYCIVHIGSSSTYKEVPNNSSKFYTQDIDILASNSSIETIEIFPNYKKSEKQKILFYDTWFKVLEQNSWIDAHHLHFESVNQVISYTKKYGIKYIYGQMYNGQKFLFQNKKKLEEVGLKFIPNKLDTVRLILSKRKFYEFMEDKNFDNYIPKYYKTKDEVEYPCISKQVTAANGETITIIKSPDELFFKDDYVLNEYIVDDTEYATNLFFKDEILCEVTYEKQYTDDIYVLNDETKYKVTNKKIVCPFKKEFTQIIKEITSKGEYLSCCIDYKIKDGIPKIFEINVRFGYTLARYEDDFKQMMKVYMKECDNVKY